VVLKLVVGLAIGSVSVISEAIHSAVDLLAAIIALFAVRKSAKPADEDHPFGHGKVENVSGAIEALLIFVAAGWIIYEAIEKLRHPAPLDAAGWGVAVMLTSAVVNVVVSHFLFKVGNETDSIALKADAWHLRTDVYTSAGVMVGLGLIWLGRRLWPQASLEWIDPVAAIGVALLIIKAAWDLTRDSARDLLDAQLPEEEVAWIRSYIADHRGVVRGVHDLRTRKSGSQRFVEFHVLVPSDMSVEQSHDQTNELAQGIKERFPGTSVTIHVDPCREDCTTECVDDCLLSEEERAELHA
jgi:cation diffusion facilitator family transporter